MRIAKKLFPVGSHRRRFAKKTASVFLNVKTLNYPHHLLANQRSLSEEGKQQLVRSLRENYFSNPAYYQHPVEEYLSTEVGQRDLESHMDARLEGDRRSRVPWLDDVSTLDGATILEIGCGTGSSTVALAEQGANVTGVDIHEGSLKVAEDRCKAYNLNARFIHSNATEISKHIEFETFDFIIFFASLEHMTMAERLESLKTAWNRLSSGRYLVVTDTPNRLWYFDFHTSLTPFFFWLPDELALLYSGRTPRELYNKTFQAPTDEAKLLFSRWGRGVSFHDFEVAIDCPAEQLPVVSCMSLFLRAKTNSDRLYKRSLAGRYESILAEIYPAVHRGFYLQNLDLVFMKP